VPISCVELAFFTSPVDGEIIPGMPTPTLPAPAELAVDRATSRDRGHRPRIGVARLGTRALVSTAPSRRAPRLALVPPRSTPMR
jgi:hypothetical protein